MRLDTKAIEEVLKDLDKIPNREKLALLEDLERLEKKTRIQACREDFLKFCHAVYPGFKEGPHHRHLKPKLHDICHKENGRMTVSMAPRFGKSELTSFLFVAWYLGHHPDHHIMMVTHTATLSASFGRKVRNLIDSAEYQEIFPGTKVSKDKSAADDWTTTVGGKYLAVGVGGSVAGHGAHLCLADDLCIYQNSVVDTTSGPKKAQDISVGDKILGRAGYQRVTYIGRSVHEAQISFAGTTVSANHPVWTENRGWQRADTLQETDILRTASFWYKLAASTKECFSEFVQRLPPRVQHLVHDETAVQEPESGQLRQLRRQGGHVRPGVGEIRPVYAGYGTCAFSQAYAGPYQQRAWVQQGQLPLGRRGDAAEQPHQRAALRVQWRGAFGPADSQTYTGIGAPAYSPTEQDGHDRRGSAHHAKNELGSEGGYSYVSGRGAGNLRHAGESRQGGSPFARLARCGQSTQAYLVRNEKVQHVFGLLLGVRRVGKIEAAPADGLFVTISVEGDNTFFCDGVLTHNCSEQAVLSNPDAAFNTAWEYMQVGPFQRLMPGGRIIQIATRWGTKDPIGRALAWSRSNPLSPQWDEVNFPAILPSGKSLWPEQWPIEQLIAKRESMYPQFWAAQYLQSPTNEEGALIKREWWKKWELEDAPKPEYVIMALDAAAETTNRSDHTSITVWGVFSDERFTSGASHIILLDSINERMEFPKLKDTSLEQWRKWDPDCFIVERKSSGAALYQELRRLGIPVQEFMPSRNSGDKYARLNAVADIFRSGLVWYPAGRKWAEEVVEQVAAFPYGDGDDIVDTTSMALARFRNGGFIRLPTDEQDDERPWRRKREYY